MKRFIQIAMIIVALLLIETSSVFAQATFETGKLGVSIGTYGRIRFYTPDLNGTKQMERISILVGASQDAVFDYQNDVDAEVTPYLVTNPQNSDFEIYGEFNNSYSSNPPDVLEKLSVMGWSNGSYLLLKFTVVNREQNTIDAKIGLDIIPILDGEYGYDTVSYDGTNNLFRSHRGGTNIGYKLLSNPLTSLVFFEWYDGYEVDASYWGWLNHNSIDQSYVSNTADGPVIIPSQDAIALSNGQSVTIYYAVAVGSNESEMLANMQAAQQKYSSITVVADKQPLPTSFSLDQNYPNPFNPSTKISYQLPQSGFVTLKVYNAIGKEVATLVNEEKSAGRYEINFDAAGLTSGVYFYKITTNNFTQTNKMLLIK